MNSALPSDSFSCFPKLPLELQSRIWSETLTPRTIAVQPEYLGYTVPPSTLERCTHWKLRIRAAAAPMTIMQVCREARAEALRRYTEIRDDDDKHTGIYIDFARDTLYLAWTHTRPLELNFHIAAAFFYQHCEKVQSLALDIFYLADGIYDPLIELDGFSSLQELIFVAPPTDCTKTWSESCGIELKDIELPSLSIGMEFDNLFNIVCLFYKNFPSFCKSAFLAESYESPDQLARHWRTSVQCCVDEDLNDLQIIERPDGIVYSYTWTRREGKEY